MDHPHLHNGIKATATKRNRVREDLLEKIKTILPRTALARLDQSHLSFVMRILEHADNRWFFFFKGLLVRNYQQLLFAKDQIMRQSQTSIKNLEKEIVENKIHKADQ